MARTEITPITLKYISGNSTGTSAAITYSGTGRLKKCDTNGFVIKTTGKNATKMIFVVERSSKSTGTGTLTLVAGTTATGTTEPYSKAILGNFTVYVSSSTGTSRTRRVFGPIETARFLDTNMYLKINCSSVMTTKINTSKASYVGCFLIP